MEKHEELNKIITELDDISDRLWNLVNKFEDQKEEQFVVNLEEGSRKIDATRLLLSKAYGKILPK